jgi:hypothetical protein
VFSQKPLQGKKRKNDWTKKQVTLCVSGQIPSLIGSQIMFVATSVALDSTSKIEFRHFATTLPVKRKSAKANWFDPSVL